MWVFWIYFWFPKKPVSFQTYLKDFSLLSHLNKVLGFSSLQILAFVYLGSVFASLNQLKSGTKYQRFPPYLDFWLSTSKLDFVLNIEKLIKFKNYFSLKENNLDYGHF